MTTKQVTYLSLAAVALLLLAYAGTAYKVHQTMTTPNNNGSNLPRGYRNNNPLNIRISNNQWKGKVTPNKDGAFEQFISMPYGFRAAFVLIRNYINNGYNTISKIISRWAPASENNTASYIEHVASWSGIDADRILSPTDANMLIPIVYAMARSENGYYPQMQDVKQGWNLI